MAPALSILQAVTTDVTRPYTTGTITPTANGLVILAVGITGSATDTATRLASDVSSTIGGLGPWQIVQQSNPGAVSKTAIYVWYAQAGASPTPGTITLNPGGVTPADSQQVVLQVTGHDTSVGPVGTVGAFSTVAAPTLTLTASPTVDDLTLNFSVSRNDSNGATAGTGFTLAVNSFHANPSASTAVGSRTGSTSTTVPFAGLGTVHSSLLAFNLANAPAGGTVWQVDGTSVSTSAATGVVAALLLAAGVATSTSAASGSPTVLSGVAGVAASTSTASGSPTVLRAVAGVAASTSSAAGAPTARLQAAGTATATSAATGTVTATLSVSGTSVSTSAASGSPTVLGGPVVWQVDGTSVSTSTANGSPTARRVVAGVAASTSGASGSVSLRAVASGTSVATSAASGSPTVISPDSAGPVTDPRATLTVPASVAVATVPAAAASLTATPPRAELT